MSRLLLSSVALSCLFLLSPSASADDPPLEIFLALDADGDGVLEAEEIKESQKAAFKRLLRTSDGDGNGEITRKEFIAGTTGKTPMPVPVVGADADGAKLETEALFNRFDTDGDGKLTVKELPEPLQDRLKPFFDRTGRDSISIEEFTRMRSRMAQGMTNRNEGGAMANRQPKFFRLLDTDGDGSLSAKELEGASRLIGELDSDDDGKLSLRELAGMPGRRPGTDSPMTRRNPAMASRFFERLDKNKNGSLEKDEIPDMMSRMKENFDRLDADSDGSLSEAEMKSAFERMQQRRKQD